MTIEEAKELKLFKDSWAQAKGYEDWYDYKDHCDSHGFDESEIGYDKLMFDYGQVKYQQGKSSNSN